MNPSAVERQRQLVSVELRIVPRPRDRAYVDYALDAVRVQKANEVFNCTGRVTDREDNERRHVSSTTISMSPDGFQLLGLMTAPLSFLNCTRRARGSKARNWRQHGLTPPHAPEDSERNR